MKKPTQILQTGGAYYTKKWAKNQGFETCRRMPTQPAFGGVLYLVSQDKAKWFMMHEELADGHQVYRRVIDLVEPFLGSFEEVCVEAAPLG